VSAPSAKKKGGKKGGKAPGPKVFARNKRARFDYHIDEALEAGLALAGSEVKSIRAGKVTLTDSFAEIQGTEAWLLQMDVNAYGFAHARNHENRRRRKLLLHRREIDRLAGKLKQKGYTLVPLQLYEKRGFVKVELGLAHGKQEYDRRQDVKKREADREVARHFRR